MMIEVARDIGVRTVAIYSEAEVDVWFSVRNGASHPVFQVVLHLVSS